MSEYAPALRREAVARAREIGTRAAAHELRIAPQTLRAWRRAENRSTRAQVPADLSELEARIDNATTLAEIHKVQAEIARLCREIGVDPLDHGLALIDDAA